MLIVKYWSMFHLYAQLKISLLFSLLWLDSLLPLLHPLPNLSRPIICLLSLLSVSLHTFPVALLTVSHPALPFLLPLDWSYHRITFIGIAVCFRSRVDEEGALSRRVDLFSALVLIGGASSWLTGPAQKNQIFSSTFTFVIRFSTTP